MRNFVTGILVCLSALFLYGSITDTKIELDGIEIYNNSGRVKFTSGIEVDSLKLPGGSIPNILNGSATLNFGDLSGKGTTETLTFTLTGAQTTDEVILGLDGAVATTSEGVFYMAWVSSANTISVRAENRSDLTPNPDPGLFQAIIIR